MFLLSALPHDHRPSLLAALLIQFGAFAAGSHAQEKPEFHLQDSESAISFFCDYALLVDRGVACLPFSQPADGWILDRFRDSAEFRKFVGLSESQLQSISAQPRRVRSSESRSNSKQAVRFVLDDEEAIADLNILETVLNEDQKAKLVAVYLNLEGLAALRRFQFRKSIGITADEQEKIIDLINESSNNRARTVHQRIFTLPNDQLTMLPKLNLELRHISADLDHEIAQTLTPSQSEQLAKTVAQATHISKLVQGPGVGFPWRIVVSAE